ncbi:quinolinate synthase [Pyrus ussuriensis x Pyrus communis]|uniref:Quinolinate synthase n=1 Tax=Pyrus ussuriensis x Pyrus communis TaxID=2448454 RepID=A0A5N5G1K7_9ROSA|nr:quinolinate synthase [Pyrus ussuriensis x Pyrus communis]
MDASSAPTMALRVFSSSCSSSSSSSASFKPNKSLPFKFTTFRPPPQPTLFKSLKCIQTPPSSNPNPLKHPPPPPQNSSSASPFSCSALTLSPSRQTTCRRSMWDCRGRRGLGLTRGIMCRSV